MRTLINAATLRGRGSGAVGRAIIEEFLWMSGPEGLRAFVPREWPSPVSPGVERAVGPGAAAKFVAENWAMRKMIREWPADRVFSLGDTSLPYCTRPHLLLVQTPYLAYGDEERDFRMSRAFRARLALLELYFGLGLRTVSALTVQSEHMKKRLAKRWSLPEEKVLVVPSALEPIDPDPVSHSQPFVVYPATASPHKNHVVLAGVMEALRARRLPIRCLVTVRAEEVPDLAEAASKKGVLESFEFVGNTTHRRALGLMGAAVGVLLPAKMETFGLPYFEAMSLGAPVIAADRECAREACGEAALYANADSGAEFADHVQRLWESPELARELGAQGRLRYQSARVTWPQVARRYWEALEAISGHAHLRAR